MRLKTIIKADKSNLQFGKWNVGHITRSAFPLSKVKEKSYKLGKAYKWRLVRFTALERNIRVLIVLNEEKEIFRARLAVEDNSDLIVVCEHEFHASEPGWHCHYSIKDVNSITPGAYRDGKRKRPTSSDVSAVFNVNEANALAIAAQRYGFDPKGDLL
jgi:hypothetical protein